MVVKNTKVYGIEQSFKASKYPMSLDTDFVTADYTDRIKSLAGTGKGEGHDNFLKGIIVQFDLTFTIKAWTEAERYHWFEIVSSQSTMHRIAFMDYDKTLCSYVTEATKKELKRLKEEYKNDPSQENYLRLLYNCPTGLKLTAGMTTNYRQLKTIYSQRRNHRLPEWQEFCNWIEQLPYAELITGRENEDRAD